ncbi:hypothetical protein WA158_002171 [Blastocystis sp. Blastoise]
METDLSMLVTNFQRFYSRCMNHIDILPDDDINTKSVRYNKLKTFIKEEEDNLEEIKQICKEDPTQMIDIDVDELQKNMDALKKTLQEHEENAREQIIKQKEEEEKQKQEEEKQKEEAKEIEESLQMNEHEESPSDKDQLLGNKVIENDKLKEKDDVLLNEYHNQEKIKTDLLEMTTLLKEKSYVINKELSDGNKLLDETSKLTENNIFKIYI